MNALPRKDGRALVSHFVAVFQVTTAALFLFALNGCAAYNPKPLAQIPFMERALTKTRGGVTVTAAVLGPEESRQAFGANLARREIQPVWLKIVNNEQTAYWLFKIRMDPDYFSPREVAWQCRDEFFESDRRKMEDYCSQQRMPIYIPAGATRSGFCFTNLEQGRKEVLVELVSHAETKHFAFYFTTIPGFRSSYQKVTVGALYAKDKRVACDDEKGLATLLASLPCWTTNEKGNQTGDALNLVIIGDEDEIVPAMMARGWQQAEELFGGSQGRTVNSFFYGNKYLYAPMMSLYVYGRSQDKGVQKSRYKINDRNHLRLWLTPIQFNGKPVWVGSITRDIGITFHVKAGPFLLTHKIDSDIDEARAYFIQDMLDSRRVAKVGFVEGIGLSDPAKRPMTLTGDPINTDGFRAVFLMRSEPTHELEFKHFNWEYSGHHLFEPGR
jgi:hypothetical protein